MKIHMISKSQKLHFILDSIWY